MKIGQNYSIDARGAVLQFEKRVDGSIVRCEVEPCSDGSVYVEGDEIEMIFEFAPDCLTQAIKHVESLGYVRIA